MKHVANFAAAVAMVIGGLCLASMVGCSDADGSEAGSRALALRIEEHKARAKAERERFDREWAEREREREERWAKIDAELDESKRQFDEEMSNRPKRRHRKVRRFQWESPAETRGKLWNIPEEESEEATLEAFLRVCIAEADGNPQDCVGIWQVVKNNRRRTCDRGNIRRITECVDGEGETFLSALRRHQRHVLGYIKARNKRATWISKMTLDCENPPEEFFSGLPEDARLNQWDARYQKRCSEVVELGRHLIKGELPPPRPGQTLAWLPHRPITWGGRCESGKASCDDQIACSRGLNRIPDTDTFNAFWCRPGKSGCPEGIDPVCQEYRQKTVPSPSHVETAVNESPPSSTPQS